MPISVPTTSSSFKAQEFTAVILAATCGARLFPITSNGQEENALFADDFSDDGDKSIDGPTDDATPMEVDESSSSNKQNEKEKPIYMPKHLLPIAGTSILQHLLSQLQTIGLELCIIAIAADDDVTLSFLQRITDGDSDKDASTSDATGSVGNVTILCWKTIQLVVVKLPQDCCSSAGGGSADALRYISNLDHPTPVSCSTEDEKENNISMGDTSTPVLPPKSNIMILPADLILYGNLMNQNNTGSTKNRDALGALADAHRAACQQTMLHQIMASSPSPYDSGSSYVSSLSPPPPPTAITVLLTDVGETDDNGIPLKESTKAKKGGIAREDEDIEYIALSPINTTTSTTSATLKSSPRQQRIILKESKYNVEEDGAETGATPKLTIPKSHLFQHSSQQMTIRTDWSDVHVFVLSPWVLKILHARPQIKDLSKDFIPMLIRRQFRGVRAAFGLDKKKSTMSIRNATSEENGAAGKKEEQKRMLLKQLLMEPPFTIKPVRDALASASNDGIGEGGSDDDDDGGKDEDGAGEHNGTGSNNDNDNGDDGANLEAQLEQQQQLQSDQKHIMDYPFIVAAKVLSHTSSKLTLRACTIPAYLYSSREIVSHALGSSSGSPTPSAAAKASVLLPEGTRVNSKFNSIMMEGSSMGDKVNLNSSAIGRRSKLGNRCRLNNVIVMDDVTIGDNCSLQNSILATGSVIGNNCTLNDCHVGQKYTVPTGTKGKGESYHS